LDHALGLIGGFTPGAAQILSRTAAQLPYEESSQQVRELAGLSVDASQIQRLVGLLSAAAQTQIQQLPEPAPVASEQFYISVDGTGGPMVRGELEGRRGRQPDGQAKTREVKLAALFTQSTLDAEGCPVRDPDSTTYLASFDSSDQFGLAVRDPDSTTYLASFDSSDQFGLAVRQAAHQRALAQAREVIYLGDGAAWVWEVARTCFPQAVQILDYYHASEHVVALAKACHADPGCAQNWGIRWQSLIYDSQLETLLEEAAAVCEPANSEERQRELDYLQRNQARMDYLRYRQAGWFIRSGVVDRLQTGDRPAPQAIGHVLDPSGGHGRGQLALRTALSRRLGLPLEPTPASGRLTASR
jgi:hypothetical protein